MYLRMRGTGPTLRSAGRHCLRWLRLSFQFFFYSVEFEIGLPEWSHQLIKHAADSKVDWQIVETTKWRLQSADPMKVKKGINLQICKLRCFTWWQTLGETHLALEPRRWEAWTSIFSMANSSAKFLPLASLRQLDWHRRKLHVFVFSLYIQCFCVSLPVP